LPKLRDYTLLNTIHNIYSEPSSCGIELGEPALHYVKRKPEMQRILWSRGNQQTFSNNFDMTFLPIRSWKPFSCRAWSRSTFPAKTASRRRLAKIGINRLFPLARFVFLARLDRLDDRRQNGAQEHRRAVDAGKHDELIRRCPLYKVLYRFSLSGEVYELLRNSHSRCWRSQPKSLKNLSISRRTRSSPHFAN
jgi:hypothetical protein